MSENHPRGGTLRVLETKPGDQLVPITKLRHPLDRSRNLPLATVLRWAVNGKNGIRLPVVRIGRRLATTDEALMQFCADTTSAATGATEANSGKRMSFRRAEEKLRQIGI